MDRELVTPDCIPPIKRHTHRLYGRASLIVALLFAIVPGSLAPVSRAVASTTGDMGLLPERLPEPAKPDSNPVHQIPGTGFQDGSAPSPPLDSPDLFSYAHGYVSFSTSLSCSPGGPDAPTPPSGGGAGQGESIGIPQYLKSSKKNNVGTTSIHQDGTGQVVLGSRLFYHPTFAKDGRHKRHTFTTESGSTRKKEGFGHIEGGNHAIATIQRLENGAIRSIGYHTQTGSKSGDLRPGCFVGDAVGGPKEIFKDNVKFPVRAYEAASAQLSYTKSSACLNCNAACPPRQPYVICGWGETLSDFPKYNGWAIVAVESFSPVSEIWDGISERQDSLGDRGDYNINLYSHQYYYYDPIQGCGTTSCSSLTTSYNNRSTKFPYDRESWGRNGGDSGFIEHNLHNIYTATIAKDQMFEEDPEVDHWDICTGSVPGSPCIRPIVEAPDIEIDVVTYIPENTDPVPAKNLLEFVFSDSLIYRPTPCFGQAAVATGDDRSNQYGGSYRTRQTGGYTVGVSYEEMLADTAWTAVYDKASSVVNDKLTTEARNDKMRGDCHLKHYEGRGTRYGWKNEIDEILGDTVRIKVEGQSGTPVLWSPFCASCISWEVYVSLIPSENNMNVFVGGKHDGFPNYEVYVNQHLIYSSDHNAIHQLSDDVFAPFGIGHIHRLAPPMEVNFGSHLRIPYP